MRGFWLLLLGFGLVTVSSASSVLSRLTTLGQEYGITFDVVTQPRVEKRPGYDVKSDPVREDILERYMRLLDAEWRRYPVALIKRVGLKRVVIGQKVTVLGQPRAAVPDFEADTFWLDADVGVRIPRYGREVLHHDFFHMIDEHDSPDGRRDVEWEKLNPPTVKYGKGGWFMQSGNVGALREDLPGFLTEYATSAVEEDKAEVFGHLMTSPAFVRRLCDRDPVLAAKVGRLKELLAKFVPDMDEAWWRRQFAVGVGQ